MAACPTQAKLGPAPCNQEDDYKHKVVVYLRRLPPPNTDDNTSDTAALSMWCPLGSQLALFCSPSLPPHPKEEKQWLRFFLFV